MSLARRRPLVAALALVLLVAGCGNLPIRIALQSATVDLSVVTNTQGEVLYPSAASAFQKASVNVASATVDGTLSANNLSGSTTFTFYGRTQDPATDTNCFKVIGFPYYACPAAQEAATTGPMTLSPSAPSSALHLTGKVLATAADKGRIWLGAAVQGSTSTNATLDFTHLVASVTLF